MYDILFLDAPGSRWQDICFENFSPFYNVGRYLNKTDQLPTTSEMNIAML